MKKAGRRLKLGSASPAFRRTFPNSYILTLMLLRLACGSWPSLCPLTLNEYSKYVIYRCTVTTATLLKSPKINVANSKATRLLNYTHEPPVQPHASYPHLTIVVTLSLYWPLCDSSSIFQAVDTNFEGGGVEAAGCQQRLGQFILNFI